MTSQTPPIVLLIGGLDPSGGAGVLADLRVTIAFGVVGMAVVSTNTVQTGNAFLAQVPCDARFVNDQLDALAKSYDVRVVKVGALGSRAIAEVVASFLERKQFPVVVDPVLVSTTGGRLADDETVRLYRERFIQQATLITPNLDEVAALTGQPRPRNMREAERLAARLVEQGASAVLVKGGHAREPDVVDVLVRTSDDVIRFRSQRLSVDARGTGCALSTGIACGLARGDSLTESIEHARAYLDDALRNSFVVGGARHLNHLAPLPPISNSIDVGKPSPPSSSNAYDMYMHEALRLAEVSASFGDVPVGAVIVDEDGAVIGRGMNTREHQHDPAGHAEIQALREAAQHRKSWRLTGCTLVVTLEPCAMCAGAMVNAQIARCVFATPDEKAGAAFSQLAILNHHALNHRVDVVSGVLQSTASEMLRQFFRSRQETVHDARLAHSAIHTHAAGAASHAACYRIVIDERSSV